MRPRAGWIAAAALAALAPARSSANDSILATTFGETAFYASPWDTVLPLTTFGLQFWNVDHDVDLGFGGTFGTSFGGDILSAGSASADFRVRFHEDLRYGEEFALFGMAGVSYRHLWAEGVPASAGPPETPAVWVTRSGFGVVAGGGFIFTADGFYLELLVHGDAALMWPEASYLAGGGVDLSLGVYLD